MRDSNGSGNLDTSYSACIASAHATPVWITNVRVKAKNDFGGFTGLKVFSRLRGRTVKSSLTPAVLSASGHTYSQVLERLVVR